MQSLTAEKLREYTGDMTLAEAAKHFNLLQTELRLICQREGVQNHEWLRPKSAFVVPMRERVRLTQQVLEQVCFPPHRAAAS